MVRIGSSLTSIFIGLLALAANPVRASVVFDQWTSINPVGGHHVLTVSDSGGQFQWNLTVNPWNAEVLGLFVDLGAVSMPSSVAVSGASAAVGVVGLDTSADSCGSGCNLNGLSLPALAGGDWELVFRLGSAGFDGIQTFSWTTSDFGLDESAIRLVAVRAQQLCSGSTTLPSASCTGSDKAYAWPTSDVQGLALLPTADLPPSVDTPATMALLMAGWGAMVTARRRAGTARHV